MYNDAAVKLMYLQNTDSLIFEEDDQIVNLNKKVEMLMAANEDLKRKYDETYAQLTEERQENYKLTEEVIPSLESQVQTLSHKAPRKGRSLCVQRIGATGVDGHLPHSVSKPPPVKTTPNKAKPKGTCPSQDEAARKVASVGKNSVKGFYMPSFMRNKRFGRKDSKAERKDE